MEENSDRRPYLPEIDKIRKVLKAYDKLKVEMGDKQSAIEQLPSLFPELDKNALQLITKDLHQAYMKDLKYKFGLVENYKMGKVHLNGEFTLYLQLFPAKYYFMNCEFSLNHPDGIRVHTRTEITRDDFEKAKT